VRADEYRPPSAGLQLLASVLAIVELSAWFEISISQLPAILEIKGEIRMAAGINR
jgi:hypothetical protein